MGHLDMGHLDMVTQTWVIQTATFANCFGDDSWSFPGSLMSTFVILLPRRFGVDESWRRWGG